MRRRYREGAQLTKREFVDQPWTCGMLTLEQLEERERLGLWVSGPNTHVPPLGPLWGQRSPLALTTPSASRAPRRWETAGFTKCGTARLAVLRETESCRLVSRVPRPKRPGSDEVACWPN